MKCRIKPRSAKNKGMRLQKLVGERISKLIGLPFGPDEDIASRESGQPGTDIRLSKKARKWFPFSIEAKNQERISIYKAIEQAKSNMYENTDWLVVAKKNHHDPIVIMDLEVFFGLLERLEKYRYMIGNC